MDTSRSSLAMRKHLKDTSRSSLGQVLADLEVLGVLVILVVLALHQAGGALTQILEHLQRAGQPAFGATRAAYVAACGRRA